MNETQQQATQYTLASIYETYAQTDFGDPSDNESEPFLQAFCGLVKKIIDDDVEPRFRVAHEEGPGYVATKIREGHYFVELKVERSTPKGGYYKAHLQVRAESFAPTNKAGMPVVIGQGKTRRPSKVLPFIFQVFGLVKREQEVNQDE